MKKTWVVVLCLAIAGMAWAQGTERKVEVRKRVEMRGDMRGDMMEKLNLTPEQKEKLGALRSTHQKEMVTTQAAIKIARIDLGAQMHSEKPDRAVIEKKVKEIADLQLKEKLSFVDHMFAVRGILTADQVKVWREGAGKHFEMMMDMRGGDQHQQMRRTPRGGMRGGMWGDAQGDEPGEDDAMPPPADQQ